MSYLLGNKCTRAGSRLGEGSDTVELFVRDYGIPWITLRLCNPGGLQRDFIDSEGLSRDHMDYERDFMDFKCKSRNDKNTKLYTDHAYTGNADKKSWLR